MNECTRHSHRNDSQHQPAVTNSSNLHLAWLQFIRYCGELGHGEIEKLKIQNGLPMIAELAVKKIKFAL